MPTPIEYFEGCSFLLSTGRSHMHVCSWWGVDQHYAAPICAQRTEKFPLWRSKASSLWRCNPPQVANTAKRGAKGRSQRPRSMRPTRSSKGPMGTMLLLTTPLTRSRARWAGMPGVADAEAAHERAQINNVLLTRLLYSRCSRVGPRVVRGWFKYNKR